MAYNSLNDNRCDQKHFTQKLSPIEIHDKLYNELQQVVALISVTNCQEFLDLERSVIRNYLWALENIALSALDAVSMLDKSLDRVGRML